MGWLAGSGGMTTNVQQLLASGGYFALFGLLFACGLGLPLPEDIPLLLAGWMISVGRMHWATAGVCAWCGIVGGDVVLYNLGKAYALEVRRIPVVGRHLTTKRLEQVHRLFERWGVWVVAVGRLFAGIRGAMVVVAGATRFSFWKFLIADGLAAVVSGGLFLALGFLFGSEREWLFATVDRAKFWILIGVIVIGGVIWLWIWQRGKTRDPQAPVPADSPAK